MQETKYYCDRCGTETKGSQHNRGVIGIAEAGREGNTWKAMCKICEIECKMFITKKPKTTNTKTK